jgi:UTP--glucose-1-phosphate uridylyltransferase
MLPATKAVPKEMLPIGRKPALQWIVEECVASGIELVILITGRYKGALQDHFDVAYEVEDTLAAAGKTELLERIKPLSEMVDVVSVRQHRALGLGHAVGCARPLIGKDESFAVLLPDDIMMGERPATRQLIELHEETGLGAFSLVEVPPGNESMYGIVAGECVGPNRYRVRSMVEKPSPDEAPSNLGIVGRYVLPGSVFEYISDTKPGKGGEIQLTDALLRVMENEGLLGQILDAKRFDTGEVGGLIEANLAVAMADPQLRQRILAFMKPYF